jgi:hypothetical protein
LGPDVISLILTKLNPEKTKRTSPKKYWFSLYRRVYPSSFCPILKGLGDIWRKDMFFVKVDHTNMM